MKEEIPTCATPRRALPLALAWLILVPLAMAPANQQPEQISGAQPEWESASGKCIWPFCGGLHIAEVVDETDTVVRQVVYGPAGPMWQLHADGTSEYLHVDARGNVAMLTEGAGPPMRASGDVLERITFDPYGLPRFQDSANADKRDTFGVYLAESEYGNTQLFGGLWYEPEMGLRTGSVQTDRGGYYRLGGGLYNPDEGRLATRPPIPTAQTVHLKLESAGADAGGETGHAHGHLDYLKKVGDPATAGIAIPNLLDMRTSDTSGKPSSANASSIKKLSSAQSAAIAIPNLLDARKSGNESAAIGTLRTLVTTQALHGDDDQVLDVLDDDDDADSTSQANRRYLYFAKTADVESSCWIRFQQPFDSSTGELILQWYEIESTNGAGFLRLEKSFEPSTPSTDP